MARRVRSEHRRGKQSGQHGSPVGSAAGLGLVRVGDAPSIAAPAVLGECPLQARQPPAGSRPTRLADMGRCRGYAVPMPAAALTQPGAFGRLPGPVGPVACPPPRRAFPRRPSLAGVRCSASTASRCAVGLLPPTLGAVVVLAVPTIGGRQFLPSALLWREPAALFAVALWDPVPPLTQTQSRRTVSQWPTTSSPQKASRAARTTDVASPVAHGTQIALWQWSSSRTARFTSLVQSRNQTGCQGSQNTSSRVAVGISGSKTAPQHTGSSWRSSHQDSHTHSAANPCALHFGGFAWSRPRAAGPRGLQTKRLTVSAQSL